MDVLEDKPHSKKAFIRKRNKKQFIIQTQLDALKREQDRQQDMQAQMSTSAEVTTVQGDAPWMSSVAQYRSRIDDKRRLSKERWNRFAGTGESGGRGL